VLASLGVVELAWIYPLLGVCIEDGDDGIILRNVAVEVTRAKISADPV